VTKIIQICEDLGKRNEDGYLSGLLANVANYGKKIICKGTVCSPFTGTVIGIALDQDPKKYPRNDLGGDPYIPMFNGGKDKLDYAAFYGAQNADDCFVQAIVDWNLGDEIDPRGMRRGDAVQIDWYHGEGHAVFCWDVHLNKDGKVDCFQFLGANGGDHLPGVSIHGCVKPWITGAGTGKKGEGTLKRVKTCFDLTDDQIVGQGHWYVLPEGGKFDLPKVAKGTIKLDTFKVKPGPIKYPDPSTRKEKKKDRKGKVILDAKTGKPIEEEKEFTFTVKHIRVARFHYTDSVPEPNCMKTVAKQSGPPGNMNAPTTTVPGKKVQQDPSAPQTVQTQPAPQDQNMPTVWQHNIEDALHVLFKANWIDKDPGKPDNINDAKTQAAIRDFQTKFHLDAQAPIEWIPLGRALALQLGACVHQHVAQEQLAKLHDGNKLNSDPGPADGTNNPKTKNAVMEFQRMFPPLDPSGIPDAATQAKLQEVIDGHAPSSTQHGLEPAIDALYWVPNTAPVGGPGTLQIRSTDLQHGHDFQVLLKNASGGDEVDAGTNLTVMSQVGRVSVPIPAEKFPKDSLVRAHVKCILPGGKTLDVTTDAPLHVGQWSEPSGQMKEKEILQKLGYYDGPINDDWSDQASKDVLKTFQRDKKDLKEFNLRVTGALDDNTKKALQAFGEKLNGAPGLQQARRWRLTRYFFVHENSFSDPANVPVYDKKKQKLATVGGDFFAHASLEGSGVLKDGRKINVNDRIAVDNMDSDYAAVLAYAKRKLAAHIGYAGINVSDDHITKVQTFKEITDVGEGYGKARGLPMRPFRSLACDIGAYDAARASYPSEPRYASSGGLVPSRTRVFIVDFVGAALPDGTTHDGWCIAHDTGSAIFGAHFDVFCGTEAMKGQFDGHLPEIGSIWFEGLESRVARTYSYGLTKDGKS
jgi:peptidoglycan hydrolase-like protein with peptidoglycan-binding domain